MRAFGWVLVVVGGLLIVGTILYARENNRAYQSLCSQGKVWACTQSDSGAPGLVAAAIIGGFGILILAIRKPQRAQKADTEFRKKCPDCAELIQPDANVCRYCGYKFTTEPELTAEMAERLRRGRVKPNG